MTFCYHIFNKIASLLFFTTKKEEKIKKTVDWHAIYIAMNIVVAVCVPKYCIRIIYNNLLLKWHLQMEINRKPVSKMDGWYHNAIFYEIWTFDILFCLPHFLSLSTSLFVMKMNNTFIDSNYVCMQAFSIIFKREKKNFDR